MATATINLELQKIIQLIPGYDPVATAGDCWFDEEAAQYVIDFIEECCSRPGPDGKPVPFLLELWQKAVVANLYGWKRPDGTLRYLECFFFVPRKNGKTAFSATLICAALFLFADRAPQCYSAAADREQARIVFGDVTRMIRDEPRMLSAANVGANAVVVGDGSYKPLSSEAGTKHGLRPDLVIIDELHAHKSSELTEALMTGMAIKGRQPLTIHTTTSDYEREGSICNEKHLYASQVRDGIIEDVAFLPVIYEATLDDDWTDVEVWKAANPNYGVSLSEEYLARECRRAQHSPSFENTFKRLHLNIRTEMACRWLSMPAWDKCPATPDTTDLEALRCWCGLDLSGHLDLSSFAMVFRDEDAGTWRTIVKCWCPEERARERAKHDRAPYLEWIRQGWLTAIPGPRIDQDVIIQDIIALGKVYNIREIGIDRWNAEHPFAVLEKAGFEVFQHGQGMKDMTAPTKELEACVLDGTLDTGGNPILRWCASNVFVEQDAAGNLKPNKDKSTDKIDPIVALIMGLGRAVLHARQPERVSYYETHGVGMR